MSAQDRPGPSSTRRSPSSEGPPQPTTTPRPQEEARNNSALWELLQRKDTPTPPKVQQQRIRRRMQEEARPLKYVSLLDNRERTVSQDTYGHGSMTPSSSYRKGQRLGQGTYGTVYVGYHVHTAEKVALKKMKNPVSSYENIGCPISIIREIKMLQQLRHDNIVELIEVTAGDQFDAVTMVLEFCETDLAHLLDQMNYPFEACQVKCIMQQLLRGLEYIHSKCYIHRDIKTSNILLRKDGTLKLADFGMARAFNELQSVTPHIVTMWYRSMELLLGCQHQNTGLDIWPVGCILGELLRHKPLFPHNTEMNMIKAITDLLGAPTVAIWPGLVEMPVIAKDQFNFTDHNRHNMMNAAFKEYDLEAIELMQLCFVYDPKHRITAKQALQHRYFTTDPLPCRRKDLPIISRELD